MNLNHFIFILLVVFCSCKNGSNEDSLYSEFPELLDNSSLIKEFKGRKYRDLNKNDQLDIYEDHNLPIKDRIDDLLAQMNIEQKAGLLFIDGAPISTSADPNSKKGAKFPSSMKPVIAKNIIDKKMSHFNLWDMPDDLSIAAKWYNNVQKLAEEQPLGIPVTIASDPRHHFTKNIFASEATTFSQFCEPLGLAALRSQDIVSQFGKVVNQEYRAVGIRLALHPQIDLATEPRWPRIAGTFGEDANLSADLGKAYISALQGVKLDYNSVATMTKHFPGGGPQFDGLDPHFSFQKGQIYPGDNFDYHLIPFDAAIKAGTVSIMPYYGVPVAQTDQDVAMAFNKEIITGQLRNKYNYDGIVCTDWGLITDTKISDGVVWKARAWGVENLSEADRVLKALDAGCDQFGGETRPELVIELVMDGRLKEERLDTSVRRILKAKFELGLFDNPFIDESKIDEMVGSDENIAFGLKTQQESVTLLKNEDDVLPLSKNTLKIYSENIDTAILSEYATIVTSPQEADMAIIRLKTPWVPVDSPIPFAQSFHHGDLDFKAEEKAHILNLLKSVPTIVDIYLDRPAVIPQISSASKALVANYGTSDRSLCEVLFGTTKPLGKLPFELPSSMEAVRQQKPDLPYDSKDPLYPFGFGLKYR